MIAALAWAAEGILETTGAFFAFRRKLTILAVYLAFSAISDAIAAIIMWRFGTTPYEWAAWIQEAIQYLILCALACQLVSRMIEDYRRIGSYACVLAVVLGGIAGYMFNKGETWPNKFLDAEISASFFLVMAIAVGWIFRKRGLEEPWRMIALGLTFLASGNACCAIISSRFTMGLSLYPIPAIASLVLWNLAGIERKKIKLREIALDLPPRMPVESVRLTDEDEKWLRGLRISG